MDDDEVARYCDAMGWTADPLVNALVERLLDKTAEKEYERTAGWSKGLCRAAELVEAALDEADGRDQVDVYILDNLLQDIEAEICLECPGEVADSAVDAPNAPNAPDAHQESDQPRRQGASGSTVPAVRGAYPPVILKILADATEPIKKADLVKAVRMETRASESEFRGIYKAITNLTRKRRIREHGRRLTLA